MIQKIIVADDFYDMAHAYHKGIIEGEPMFTDEAPQKISYLLGRQVKIENLFNSFSQNIQIQSLLMLLVIGLQSSI